MENEVIIYQTEDGQTKIDVRMEKETVWLTQELMSKLFETTVPNINMHVKNIYKEKELEEVSTIKDFLIVRDEGERSVSRNIVHYNLDVIISVGYRIKSKRGTQFRIWATQTLKEYLLKGFAINEEKFIKQKEKFELLKNTVELFERGLSNQIEDLNQAKSLAALMTDFAKGLELLDDFDHQSLDKKGLTKQPAIEISKDEFLQVVENMKTKHQTDVFAQPKDESFESSVNQIYQTIGGEDCYATLEEKAAMLLYLIVKNHSFTDGNKRIGAACFLYFLDKNSALYQGQKPVIDANTLFALTLIIAESKSEEMQIIKQIVMSVLNRSKQG